MDIPKNAKSKITTSTGKVVFFREPKVYDWEQSCQRAKIGKNTDELLLAKDFTERLIVGIFRANGEQIKCINTQGVLRKDDIFNFLEVLEITKSATNLFEGFEKEGKFERL